MSDSEARAEAPQHAANVARSLVVIIVVLALYILSIGPVTYALLNWGIPSPQLVGAVYYPLLRTASTSPRTAGAISRYINFWMGLSGGAGGVVITPAIEPPPTIEAEPEPAP